MQFGGPFMVVKVVSRKCSLWASASTANTQLTVCRVCVLRNRKPRLQQAAIYTPADQHEISSRLTGPRSEVACAITREALEAPFWLPKDADQVRMLKAFADGQRRIIAVAGRKVRLRPGEPVRLTTDDFQISR
jgi:hypothetical protein